MLKKLIAGLLLIGVVGLSGCEESTPYGPCIGFGEFGDDQRQPGLIYKISHRNLILGIVFLETIIVPTIVAVDELLCPVGKK